MKVLIVAPSSVVSMPELRLGVAEIKARGLQVEVDPRVKKKDLFFAGSHVDRAQAFIDAAYREDVDVIWCARGGYGANHLLSHLEAATLERGPPKKAKWLVGSSDATSLLQFARVNWGFAALHAPMPGLRKFALLSSAEKDSVFGWILGARGAGLGQDRWPVFRRRLKWWGSPDQTVRGRMVGGNLTVWNTLLGTRFQPRHEEPAILFLEDVTETLPRIDRAVRHLVDAGGLVGVRAIVLGNFLDCEDAVPTALQKLPSGAKVRESQLRNPPARWVRPLRRRVSQVQGLRRIFGAISRECGIPVAWGLPVGHGPEQFALPLGAEVEIGVSGTFELLPATMKHVGTARH
ncbi:MAG: LD-carboxypeptidase [Oligoflexia bacterium]